jgi:protein-L-isoaspartate O-methyltransferase
VTTPDQAHAELLTALLNLNALSEQWLPAFEAVPRHRFIPDRVWRITPESGGWLLPLDRADQPEEWLRIVYADAPVDTQVDDGAATDRGWEVTSSASQPSVVASMLTSARAEPGMRVLEIGTGTGWNAALLAHQLGDRAVTTVDVDPTISEQAQRCLVEFGLPGVCVIAGDGARGWPAGALYDRIIATVGVHTVPPSWVSQTVAGGHIVVPMVGPWQPPGVAALDVIEDGIATGRWVSPAMFMGLRADRTARARAWPGIGKSPEARGTTDIHPWQLSGNRDSAVAIGQRLNGECSWTYQPDRGQDTGVLWLLDPGSRSWASVSLEDSVGYDVEQAGPRRLFDEVEAAYRWWQRAGEPTVGDWLVTVTPAGQEITLKPE